MHPRITITLSTLSLIIGGALFGTLATASAEDAPPTGLPPAAAAPAQTPTPPVAAPAPAAAATTPASAPAVSVIITQPPAAIGTTPPAPAAAPEAAGPIPTSFPGDEIAPGLRVEVRELKQNSGGAVTLKVGLINNSTSEFKLTEFGTNPDWWNVKEFTLIDMPNKKKYMVMTDSQNKPLCSSGGAGNYQIKPGESIVLWAKFQAPPQDVAKITVNIPGAPPIEDVSIIR